MVEFPKLSAKGVLVKQYDQLASTNTAAKEMLEKGTVDQPLLISAAEQTAGHGKLSRSFYSPKGAGVYFTLGLPVSSLPSQRIVPSRFTITATVAAFQVLKQMFDADISIKWVNDLYVGNVKAAGILAEAAVNSANQLCGIVVGWGLNLSQPASLPAELKDQIGFFSRRHVDYQHRVAVIDAVGSAFLGLLDQPWGDIMKVYTNHQFLAGKDLIVDNGQGKEIGRFDHITPEGYLYIKTVDGYRTFSTGTVRQW